MVTGRLTAASAMGPGVPGSRVAIPVFLAHASRAGFVQNRPGKVPCSDAAAGPGWFVRARRLLVLDYATVVGSLLSARLSCGGKSCGVGLCDGRRLPPFCVLI